MATTFATDETFDELVKEGVVLVDFFGVNCGPCKMVAKELEEMEDEYPFINIVKVDTDECPKTAERFKINGIPDLYFYKDGEMKARELGAVTRDILEGHIAELLY